MILTLTACFWKSSFNPDPSKEVQEVKKDKLQKINHPSIYFIDNPSDQVLPQEHLRTI